jgi:class 3 adenylate cyclase
MQRAEEATYAEFERLKREVIEPSLSRHDGRLIKTTGDGVGIPRKPDADSDLKPDGIPI